MFNNKGVKFTLAKNINTFFTLPSVFVFIFYFNVFIVIFLEDQGGWLATQSTPPGSAPE